MKLLEENGMIEHLGSSGRSDTYRADCISGISQSKDENCCGNKKKDRLRRAIPDIAQSDIRYCTEQYQMLHRAILTKAITKSNQPTHQPQKENSRRQFSRRPLGKVVWGREKALLSMMSGSGCSRSFGQLRGSRYLSTDDLQGSVPIVSDFPVSALASADSANLARRLELREILFNTSYRQAHFRRQTFTRDFREITK